MENDIEAANARGFLRLSRKILKNSEILITRKEKPRWDEYLYNLLYKPPFGSRSGKAAGVCQALISEQN